MTESDVLEHIARSSVFITIEFLNEIDGPSVVLTIKR